MLTSHGQAGDYYFIGKELYIITEVIIEHPSGNKIMHTRRINRAERLYLRVKRRIREVRDAIKRIPEIYL